MNDRQYVKMQCPGCGKHNRIMVPKKKKDTSKVVICKYCAGAYAVRYSVKRKKFGLPKDLNAKAREEGIKLFQGFGDKILELSGIRQ